jgi:hypothetical protein
MSWLSLFLFLLMLGVVFFQTIHGAFSAFIMATITLLAGTLAIGMHEVFAEKLLYGMLGDFSYSLAFVTLFGATVIIGRVAIDKMVSRNTLLPMAIDKGGATLFGIITGFVSIGCMGIAIQMIPFGPTILGFERVDEDGDVHSLWLNPDGLALNVCGYLADYALGTGEGEWFEDHPDFLTEIYWYRNVNTTASRTSVKPGSVTLAGDIGETKKLYKVELKQLRRRTQANTEPVPGPPSGKQWMVVGVQLDKEAADSDNWYRASATQARIVGEDINEDTQQYSLKAFGSGTEGHIVVDNHPQWGSKTGRFDLVFEVPDGFKPRFVEYKRAGRVEARLASGKAPVDKTYDAPLQGLASNRRPGAPPPRPATQPLQVSFQNSHFGETLPVSQNVKRYQSFETDLKGSKLAAGHLSVLMEKQEDPPNNRRNRNNTPDRDDAGTEVDGLVAPDNTRLLQLDVRAVHAKTQLAGAVNLTRRVLQQYTVRDKQGRDYFMAGMIASCKTDEGPVLEIQYFPEETFAGRAMRRRPFKRFDFEDLKDEYSLILLFIVPPGTEIVSFDTGGAPVDITDLSLVAPG